MGFVPLCDCAPLVMARELGLFEKYGLRVQLRREVGWATIRDKIFYEQLDAAHALAPMVFAASLGLEGAAVDCVASLVLNLHGNAVTLSQPLAKAAVDPQALRTFLKEREHLVLGIPFLFSSHYFLALTWLKSLGLAPESAQFVVVPPPQMPLNLKAGHLDGYCVGDPWNSVAVLAGFGTIATTSARIAPRHPEKVLMVRREFAETRAEEHTRLIAALLESCRYCDAPENRGQIVETLSQKQYLNASPAALLLGLTGKFESGDEDFEPSDDFTIFSRCNANEPSSDKAAWIVEGLRESGLCKDSPLRNRAFEQQIFSSEAYDRALRLSNETQREDENKDALEDEPALS